MVLVNVISIIMMVYMIFYREVCYVVKSLYVKSSVLYSPNSCLLPNTALNNYSSCLCCIHQITIAIQNNLLCVIQFQFFYMSISAHYNIQSVLAMQCNRQSARCKYAPRTITFCSNNVFNT